MCRMMPSVASIVAPFVHPRQLSFPNFQHSRSSDKCSAQAAVDTDLVLAMMTFPHNVVSHMQMLWQHLRLWPQHCISQRCQRSFTAHSQHFSPHRRRQHIGPSKHESMQQKWPCPRSKNSLNHSQATGFKDATKTFASRHIRCICIRQSQESSPEASSCLNLLMALVLHELSMRALARLRSRACWTPFVGTDPCCTRLKGPAMRSLTAVPVTQLTPLHLPVIVQLIQSKLGLINTLCCWYADCQMRTSYRD